MHTVCNKLENYTVVLSKSFKVLIYMILLAHKVTAELYYEHLCVSLLDD